jgi:hypothetical protein
MIKIISALFLLSAAWADSSPSIQEKAASARLECAGDDCHPSVGLLTAIKPDGTLEACTASLVQSDLVMTNSHCIPSDLRTAGASCENRIWLSFAAVPGRAELERQMECAEVVSASPLEKGKLLPDMAFLRMKQKSSRPRLSVGRGGLANNTPYQIWKVDSDFGENGIAGVLSRMDCRALHETDVTGSPSALFPLMVMVDCQVVQGHSGSPVLDRNGEAVGVIQAFLPMGNARKTAADKGLDLVDGQVGPINLASNLSCADLPWKADAAPPLACENIALEEPMTLPSEPTEQDIREALAKKLDALSVWKGWQWEILVKKEKRLDSWGTEHYLRVLRAYPVCRSSGPAPAETLQLPQHILLYGLDRYLLRALRLVNDPASHGKTVAFKDVPVCGVGLH